LRRHTFALLALVVAPLTGLRGQSPAVPVDAKISLSGFATVDSVRLARAVRSGLQADSSFRIVYRPPRDSLRFMTGAEFEVARIRIVLDIKSSGQRPMLDVEATDLVSHKSLAHVSSDLPPRDDLEAGAQTVLHAFTQQLARQIK
jgi:hypothetical protein